MMHMGLRAMTGVALGGAKVFTALKPCLGCESCAPHDPKEQCPFPTSSPCLVLSGFAVSFLPLFVLTKIPTALAHSGFGGIQGYHLSHVSPCRRVSIVTDKDSLTAGPQCCCLPAPHCHVPLCQRHPLIIPTATSLSAVTFRERSLSGHPCFKPSWDQRKS